MRGSFVSAEGSGGSGGDSGNSGDSGDGGSSGKVIPIRRARREAAVREDEQLLTVKDVVFWTKGSKSKIYEASRTGTLKAILLWGNRLRFRRADVVAWLESQMTQRPPQGCS
jgi:excisionase family DNA binding protein